MDSLQLDRQSAVPLYYQIQRQLLLLIRSGKLKPGKALPSEVLLSSRLGVSRMTARQALKSLCQQGEAYSLRGKGTFVRVAKLEKNIRQLHSFSEQMEAHGSRPHSRLISFEVVPASEEAAEALELSQGEKLIRLRRVRMADSSPMGVECTYLPQQLFRDLTEKFDPRTSLYRTLLEVYGVRIARADEVVGAGLVSSEEARLLRVPAKSPVFLFTRTSYQEDGKPVEYMKSTFRGDRYKIRNRWSLISANPGGAGEANQTAEKGSSS